MRCVTCMRIRKESGKVGYLLPVCHTPSVSLSLPPSLSEVFRAFALPSAGALPFFQSVLCDSKGLPEANSTDMPQYPNAL